MLGSATKKLRSTRGASLSMALMLFLVCITVASVALVAGTATAGRLSQLSEMGQSYYDVTSAAKALQSTMPVEVEVTRTYDASAEAGSQWSLTVDDHEGLLESGKATLFQIASYDLLLFDEVTNKASTNLANKREPTPALIASGFNPADSSPELKEVSFTKLEYDPFEVKISGDAAAKISNSVNVTVYRNEDETFSFVFTQDPTEKNSSPAAYTVVASVQISTSGPTPESADKTRWDTKVTWNYLYTIAGDV